MERAVNVPLRLRAIDAEQARPFMRMAIERHTRTTGDRASFRALQVLWPDRRGRFPDEEGYDGTGLPTQTMVGDGNPGGEKA